jgi:hypothetical protein
MLTADVIGNILQATRAQKEFLNNYPHMAGQLGALARAMQQ